LQQARNFRRDRRVVLVDLRFLSIELGLEGAGFELLLLFLFLLAIKFSLAFLLIEVQHDKPLLADCLFLRLERVHFFGFGPWWS